MGMGAGVTSWLEIASSENWKADNEASAKVQRMAELVTKGILATFGIHESDIHDLDRTADELKNAYLDTGWKQPERSEFAKRIRALESMVRAVLRGAKWLRPFEPLDETIERLGRVFALQIQWLTCHATLCLSDEMASCLPRVTKMGRYFSPQSASAGFGLQAVGPLSPPALRCPRPRPSRASSV